MHIHTPGLPIHARRRGWITTTLIEGVASLTKGECFCGQVRHGGRWMMMSGGVHYGTGYPDVYQHLPSSSHTDSLQTNFTFTKERIKMKMTLFISCPHYYVNFKSEF